MDESEAKAKYDPDTHGIFIINWKVGADADKATEIINSIASMLNGFNFKEPIIDGGEYFEITGDDIVNKIKCEYYKQQENNNA